jgi:hypothetical protein
MLHAVALTLVALAGLLLEHAACAAAPPPPPAAPAGFTLLGQGSCTPSTPSAYNEHCSFAQCATVCRDARLCTGFQWAELSASAGSCSALFPVAPTMLPPGFQLDTSGGATICSNITGSDHSTDGSACYRKLHEPQFDTGLCPPPPPPPPLPPAPPAPPPALPSCRSHVCPEDFNNSGITGRFPSGADPCNATTTCVRDVFPGCTEYRGDSDSPWGGVGGWCESTIANFDTNRTMPQNIAADADHPIYLFKPPKASKAYVLYVPPSGALPLTKDAGRYEYFLFQWFKQQNIAVFMVRVPIPGLCAHKQLPGHVCIV